MRTSILNAACLLAAWAALASGGTVTTLTVPSDQRIVMLRPGADPIAVAWRHGIVTASFYGSAFKGFVGRVSTTRLRRLKADRDVMLVEQDLVAHTCAQTLPSGVNRIDAPLNSYAQINGKDERVNVDIAIIDTGIDLKHADLNVIFNKSFISGETSGQDQHGHGSHCAGIAAAIDNGAGVVGVAPGARLWALKVLDKNGSGYMSDIIRAVDYVSANASKIAVVNMSLGGQGQSSSLRQAIQSCVNQGVVIVVAAGNDSADVYGSDGKFGTSDDFIPAAYPEVAAISALADSDGKRGGSGGSTSYGADDTFASFTNYSRSVASNNPVKSPGAAIDLAAPGVDIYSTYLSSGYTTMSGTSMASPHVAGAVALYIAEHGRATNASGVYAIRQALINAAQPQTQWGPSNTKDPDSNREGCVNVANSSTPPPTNTPPTVTISQPKDGTTVTAGTAITFKGSASDTEDGTLTTSLRWTSSRDGQIGTGASFSKVLSAGTHTITASVTDSGGLTGTATISVTVGSATNTPPTVAIARPRNGQTFDAGTAISFSGSASDAEDGTLTANLAWTSSLEGWIGAGGSFFTVLSEGTHTITAAVTDSGGLRASASITITVQSSGGSGQLVVSVTTNKTMYHSWEYPVFTVRVTDGGSPVPGAHVSLRLLTASGFWLTASGTTSFAGIYRVTYYPWPPRDGYGIFYLTAEASAPGYDDATATTSFFLWW